MHMRSGVVGLVYFLCWDVPPSAFPTWGVVWREYVLWDGIRRGKVLAVFYGLEERVVAEGE
jgi:hypothetical protein